VDTRGAGVRSADGTGARRRAVVRSCLMRSEAGEGGRGMGGHHRVGQGEESGGGVVGDRRERRRQGEQVEEEGRDGGVRGGGGGLDGLAERRTRDGEGGIDEEVAWSSTEWRAGLLRTADGGRDKVAGGSWGVARTDAARRRGGVRTARRRRLRTEARSDRGRLDTAPLWRGAGFGQGRGGGGFGPRRGGRAGAGAAEAGGTGPVGRSDTAGRTRCLYGAARQQCRPGQPIRVRRVAAWPLTGGPHMSGIFQFQKTSPIAFPHKKNRYKVRKILIKFMEVGNPIWNTSHYCNFFQIFMDFELFKRFEVKLGLTNLWSIKVLATAFANQPEIHFGQGVLHGAL
jgi:hypothetical protein